MGTMPADQQRAEEQSEAEERSAPSGKILYKAILTEGEEELARPSAALFWSGLAAGLSMGFSMIAEALLTTYLPQASWTPLISKLGYSVGFLVASSGASSCSPRTRSRQFCRSSSTRRSGRLATWPVSGPSCSQPT